MRQDLLFSNKAGDIQKTVTRLITTYNKQYKAIKKTIEKHWHLLQIDPNLSPHISATPTITFRKARDQLVKSEYAGAFRSDPCQRLDTFTCGGCMCCHYMNTQSNFVLPNGRLYRPRHYANCKTPGVIYLLTCQCQCFYFGKI